MIRSIYSSISGLISQLIKKDSTASNIANINTPGYKSSRVNLANNGYGGVEVDAVEKNMTQCPIKPTGNPLDLAIEGEGFFQVRTQNGEMAYTRNGSFKVDGKGRLVTNNGDILIPELNIPNTASNISISKNGEVFALVYGQDNSTLLGSIKITSFSNPQGLVSIDNNSFQATKNSGEAIEGTPGTDLFGRIISGGLEVGNVNLLEELVDDISSSNAFKANIEALITSNEILGTILDIKK
ncbi:MAG: flagellar hook-basal body complex protein [bacterium]